MTTTAPNDSVDPGAGEQTRRADELEDWLTDIRVNLNDDPPDWLTPAEDIADPDSEPADTPPTSDDHPAPTVGRHRAAE
jgi:hypothetical protein